MISTARHQQLRQLHAEGGVDVIQVYASDHHPVPARRHAQVGHLAHHADVFVFLPHILGKTALAAARTDGAGKQLAQLVAIGIIDRIQGFAYQRGLDRVHDEFEILVEDGHIVIRAVTHGGQRLLGLSLGIRHRQLALAGQGFIVLHDAKSGLDNVTNLFLAAFQRVASLRIQRHRTHQ